MCTFHAALEVRPETFDGIGMRSIPRTLRQAAYSIKLSAPASSLILMDGSTLLPFKRRLLSGIFISSWTGRCHNKPIDING